MEDVKQTPFSRMTKALGRVIRPCITCLYLETQRDKDPCLTCIGQGDNVFEPVFRVAPPAELLLRKTFLSYLSQPDQFIVLTFAATETSDDAG